MPTPKTTEKTYRVLYRTMLKELILAKNILKCFISLLTLYMYLMCMFIYLIVLRFLYILI